VVARIVTDGHWMLSYMDQSMQVILLAIDLLASPLMLMLLVLAVDIGATAIAGVDVVDALNIAGVDIVNAVGC